MTQTINIQEIAIEQLKPNDYNPNEMSEDEFYDEIANEINAGRLTEEEKHKLIPRTPQPRVRKVSIYDLMNVLSTEDSDVAQVSYPQL